jgi:hypothetical protein
MVFPGERNPCSFPTVVRLLILPGGSKRINSLKEIAKNQKEMTTARRSYGHSLTSSSSSSSLQLSGFFFAGGIKKKVFNRKIAKNQKMKTAQKSYGRQQKENQQKKR